MNMALVAYSDESDFSDSEDPDLEHINNNVNNDSSLLKNEESLKDNKSTPKNQNCTEKNDQIENSKFDKAKDDLKFNDSDEGESDVVDDVPTVETWKVTKAIKSCDNESFTKIFKKESKAKPKLRLVLPSLTEFEDDDSDENVEESMKKKLKPSSKGTGLFAVLPKPRDNTLVPLTVSRNKNSTKPSKPKAQKIPSSHKIPSKPLLVDASHDSDEEISEKDSSDFFSLSDSGNSSIRDEIVAVPMVNPDPILEDISQSNISSNIESVSRTHERAPLMLNEPRNVQADYIPLSSGNNNASGIDAEALRRLAGRRNAKEVPNIIDINADDALMAREEWVTRALCDEKPKKSFSKKKEGNPTQQQKRKHQITYLAHQAQEREQDLQNAWGQNRFTKMQTQSKYGF